MNNVSMKQTEANRPTFPFQEIQLDSITSIELAKLQKGMDNSRAPHVFEIHTTGGLTYCVGEDLNIVASAESGSGLEQARHWEQALRQALMPVTPQSSNSKEDGGCLYTSCGLWGQGEVVRNDSDKMITVDVTVKIRLEFDNENDGSWYGWKSSQF